MKFAQTNPILGAILYNFLFGISYLPLKILTARLNGDTALLIALRFAICLVILYALKHTGRIHLRSLRDMGISILPICIFQLLNGFFETTGMCFYPSGKASVVLALIPLITTLLAIPFFHEKPSAGQFFFILLSFLGVFIVAGNSEDKAATVWGFFLLLMAAFMSSSLNLCIRKLGNHLTPLDITYAMSFAMFAIYGSISLIKHLVSNDLTELFRPLSDPVIIGCLLALSIGSSLYASALRNVIFTHMTMATASSFSGISTATAVLTGVIILREPFGFREFFGLVLVLLGIWGVNALHHKNGRFSSSHHSPLFHLH